MIGGSIGKKNYRLFIQFMFWCFSYFLYIGVSAAVYVPRIKERRGSVNGNLIVLFVAVLFWMIMLFALFVSHLTYIHKNISSIDDILAKRHRKQKTINDQFLNFAYNGERYVLRINPNTDYIWDKGFLKNWKEVMGDNVLFWIVPWGSSVHSTGDEEAGSYSGLLGDYNEEISEQWRSTLIERIKNGDYLSKS
jgi:palmitoyltransferase